MNPSKLDDGAPQFSYSPTLSMWSISAYWVYRKCVTNIVFLFSLPGPYGKFPVPVHTHTQNLEEWEHQEDAWAAVLNINKGTDAAGQKGRKRNLHPLSTLRRRGYLLFSGSNLCQFYFIWARFQNTFIKDFLQCFKRFTVVSCPAWVQSGSGQLDLTYPRFLLTPV